MYIETAVPAACEANSCPPHLQPNQNSTASSTMITDAMIRSAQDEVEKPELELKSLNEALVKMKVRSLAITYVNLNLSVFP